MTSEDRSVQAAPTKDFVIETLTRDIPLRRAVLDLIDNSIDAARATARSQGMELSEFEILIEMNEERFSIRDNCGGIPVDVARHYAFRFGTVPGAPRIPGSIGQFGVGMKRALFRMARIFTIRSRTAKESFVLPVDVDGWRASEAWEFEFAEVERGLPEAPMTERGTVIDVPTLKEGVGDAFGEDFFVSALRADIVEAAGTYIDQGLRIVLNGIPADMKPETLLTSEHLTPLSEQFTLAEAGLPQVNVRLHVGVAESNPREAGWYIYINGRLVLGPDTTEATVWGLTDDDAVPRYHNQFARFRGYAFFEADDASSLPWTTTKTGVDGDHPAYRYARRRMIAATRSVIDFLNRLKYEADESEEAGEVGPLATELDKAVAAPIQGLTSSSFQAPATSGNVRTMGVRMTSVQYRKPRTAVEKAKGVLGARSAAHVGELTFDYFYEREVTD